MNQFLNMTMSFDFMFLNPELIDESDALAGYE
jgi:hypothetical protein